MQIGVFKFFLKQLLQGLLIHPTPLKEQLYPLSGDHLTPQIGVDQADRLSDFRVIEIGECISDKANLLHNCSHINFLHIGDLLADSTQTVAHGFNI